MYKKIQTEKRHIQKPSFLQYSRYLYSLFFFFSEKKTHENYLYSVLSHSDKTEERLRFAETFVKRNVYKITTPRTSFVRRFATKSLF